MDGWNLDPARVEQTLKDTGKAADDLAQAVSQDAMERISSDVVGAGQAVTPFVPDALGNLIGRESLRFTAIGDRLRAGIIGVENAAAIYSLAQQAMSAAIDKEAAAQAKAYQDAMLAAAANGDLDFFRQHGLIKPTGPDHTPKGNDQGGASWPVRGRESAR